MRAAVFIATSLDGFIARQDGELDWLVDPDQGVEDYGFGEFMDSVEAVVVGRNTFEVVRSAESWSYRDKPFFVLSNRDLDLPDHLRDRVERRSGSIDHISQYFAQRGVDRVYVDGGATIRQFLRAGLVESLTITTLPILLGSGISLFGDVGGDITLQLAHSTSFSNGWIQSEYRVGDRP